MTLNYSYLNNDTCSNIRSYIIDGVDNKDDASYFKWDNILGNVNYSDASLRGNAYRKYVNKSNDLSKTTFMEMFVPYGYQSGWGSSQMFSKPWAYIRIVKGSVEDEEFIETASDPNILCSVAIEAPYQTASGTDSWCANIINCEKGILIHGTQTAIDGTNANNWWGSTRNQMSSAKYNAFCFGIWKSKNVVSNLETYSAVLVAPYMAMPATTAARRTKTIRNGLQLLDHVTYGNYYSETGVNEFSTTYSSVLYRTSPASVYYSPYVLSDIYLVDTSMKDTPTTAKSEVIINGRKYFETPTFLIPE